MPTDPRFWLVFTEIEPNKWCVCGRVVSGEVETTNWRYWTWMEKICFKCTTVSVKRYFLLINASRARIFCSAFKNIFVIISARDCCTVSFYSAFNSSVECCLKLASVVVTPMVPGPFPKQMFKYTEERSVCVISGWRRFYCSPTREISFVFVWCFFNWTFW